MPQGCFLLDESKCMYMCVCMHAFTHVHASKYLSKTQIL